MNRLLKFVHGTAVVGLLGSYCGNQPALPTGHQSVTVESRIIAVRIDRPFDRVYEFLVDPANWNQWAFGLGRNIRRSEGGWIADSDGGVSKVQFTPRNTFGILDHTVIRGSGQRVYVPMRLIVNGKGSELMFTLFREPDMSDAQFASDSAFVQRDLNELKTLLEK